MRTFIRGGLAHPRGYTFEHGWERAELRASLPMCTKKKVPRYTGLSFVLIPWVLLAGPMLTWLFQVLEYMYEGAGAREP